MKTLFRIVLALFPLLLAVSCKAQAPADAQIKLPDTAKIYTVVTDDFWQTNCYLIVGETGQAILFDAGDEMKAVDERLLVDIETGKSVPATKEDLDKAGFDDFITDPVTGKKLLIYYRYQATGDDAKRIYQVITDNKIALKYIIISHGHIDHLGSLSFLVGKTGAKIMMHRDDVRAADGSKIPPGKEKEIPAYPKDAYTLVGGTPKVDQFLKDGDLVKLDGIVLRVLHTPGHSPGHISLLTKWKDKTILFSADALLRHTVGRTNFRDGTGDEALLFKSIREKMFTLPDDTIVLPGHYESTTIGEEKKNNPFLNTELFNNPLPTN